MNSNEDTNLVTKWRMMFCTSWDDDPPNTVIPIEEDKGAVVEAHTAEEAKEKFLMGPFLPYWLRKYYEDETIWAEEISDE